MSIEKTVSCPGWEQIRTRLGQIQTTTTKTNQWCYRLINWLMRQRLTGEQAHETYSTSVPVLIPLISRIWSPFKRVPSSCAGPPSTISFTNTPVCAMPTILNPTPFWPFSNLALLWPRLLRDYRKTTSRKLSYLSVEGKKQSRTHCTCWIWDRLSRCLMKYRESLLAGVSLSLLSCCLSEFTCLSSDTLYLSARDMTELRTDSTRTVACYHNYSQELQQLTSLTVTSIWDNAR